MSKVKVVDIPNINNFKVPDWAGKPPSGLHLDVMKDSKLIQKLMIDEKKCYLFGRNRQLCDFSIDHQSCSRIHGALVWHKDLHRPFLIDCGSVHGTFIGSIRLESGKPQQVPIDSKIHFGASTRMYVIRERPSNVNNGIERGADESHFNSNLPEDETELDNLTEFNTAQNRRNTSIIDVQDNKVKRPIRKPNLYVHFSDQEEVINPEDIDPTIGRFRNLVQETFIPNKRQKLSIINTEASSYAAVSSTVQPSSLSLKEIVHHDHPTSIPPSSSSHHYLNPVYSAASKLGLPFPNLAPEIEVAKFDVPQSVQLVHSAQHITVDHTILSKTTTNNQDNEPRKKKYAKEAWPGKKPTGFVVGSL